MHIINLHKGREQSVLRRHPWIFSRAIQTDIRGLADGDTVWVADFKGNIIGTGHFQNSSLSVRLIAFEQVEPGPGFWRERLSEALACRLMLGIHRAGHTDAFRLVHGEGDQLPGLIIDIYGKVAVIQAHSIGMHKAVPEIAEAILSLRDLQLESVYVKSKDALPTTYAQQMEDVWVAGQPMGEVVVHENGVSFLVQVETGQKTGFFLDQRDNRSLVMQYANGKEVFNGFCYTGGFSLYAMKGGATGVTSVDTSGMALELLERNMELNGFAEGHQVVRENVMTYLAQEQRLYDIVIIDPPAFAKSLNKRHNAIQAYKRLNMQAMARVKKGGLLFTFSCSQVVDKPLFHHTVVSAAIEAGRHVRIIHELSQGADHPVSAFHPEGHYLKGLVLML